MILRFVGSCVLYVDVLIYWSGAIVFSIKPKDYN